MTHHSLPKKSIPWRSARFVASATDVHQLPTLKNSQGALIPEIAILGRSNVGKSSLLNFSFGIPLARVSSQPGRTQALQLFALQEQLTLVDLPGYGYAKVPAAIQKQWAPMVQGYLENRLPLKAALLLCDIRRDPEEEERNLWYWLARKGYRTLFVVTKADYVSQNRRKERLTAMQQILSLNGNPWGENMEMIAFSTREEKGRELLQKAISHLIYG